MQTEQSIVQLAEKLDAWWNEFSTMLDTDDRVAQAKALLRGFEIAKEFDRIKADGLAAIAALIDSSKSMEAGERAPSLVQSFAFAAKIKATLHDAMGDIDGANEIINLMAGIADELRAIGAQSAFTLLLEDKDPRVRASIGADLLIKNLLPERVVPVLREIEEKKNADDASLVAFTALFRWEHEGKQAKS